MRLAFAVLLIIVAPIWFFFIIVLGADSFMTDGKVIFYSSICLLMIVLAVYLIYSDRKLKRAKNE